jgi:putative aldouronate transport system permease protein
LNCLNAGETIRSGSLNTGETIRKKVSERGKSILANTLRRLYAKLYSKEENTKDNVKEGNLKDNANDNTKDNTKNNTRKNKSNKVFTRVNVALYLMAAPAVILCTIFHYIPLPGIALAFADFRVSGFKEWVGLENFRYLFSLKYFWLAFRNNWFFILLRYVFVFPAPILFALLLNEVKAKYYKRAVQVIGTLPHFISWVVIAGIFISVLSPTTGYVNYIIQSLGGKPVYFLTKQKLFPWLLTFMIIWKETGYSSVIYLAALSGIDSELYETGIIDGAGRLKRIIYITIPAIKGTILIMFVLSFAVIMDGLFEPVYLMKNPAVAETAEIIDTYIYDVGLVRARYSMATAVGVFKSTISLAFLLGANFLSRILTEDRKSIL